MICTITAAYRKPCMTNEQRESRVSGTNCGGEATSLGSPGGDTVETDPTYIQHSLGFCRISAIKVKDCSQEWYKFY